MVIKIGNKSSDPKHFQNIQNAYTDVLRKNDTSEKLETVTSIFELSIRTDTNDIYFIDGNSVKHKLKVLINPDGLIGGWVKQEATIAPNVFVGKGSIVLASSIGPNSKIGPRTYVGGNVKIGNNVTINYGVWIGPGIEIPDNSIVYKNIAI